MSYTPEQLAALERHGYPADLGRRGVGGGPGRVYVGYRNGVQQYLRNRVCYLDGIEIDGHEGSDITYDAHCIHCEDPLVSDDD